MFFFIKFYLQCLQGKATCVITVFTSDVYSTGCFEEVDVYEVFR